MELISNNNFIILTEHSTDTLILIAVDDVSCVAIASNTGLSKLFLKSDAGNTPITIKESIEEIYTTIKGENE